MICAKCGAPNPSESAYCGGCGSLLVPTPEVLPPSKPDAQPAASMSADMPTFHAIPPVSEQESPAVAASEFVNTASPAPQQVPGASIPPTTPPPGSGAPQMSGPLPAPAPVWPGGAYPQQGQMPGFPPQQGQMPGFPSGALYPQQGQVPGYPSGTSYPQQGQVPGYPSGTSYPQQGQVPGYPSGALYPQQTPVPGFPSGAYPQQGQPGAYAPTMNEFPAGAYAVPGQPMPGGWPAPGMFPPVQPTTSSKLINPLPRWGLIASIAAGVVLLAILTFFAGSDWAAGAQTAGIVALVLGVLVLVAFGVRTGLGMLAESNSHRRAQIVSSLLITLLLIASGAVGLTQPTGIHALQAHALEGQHNWQAAINEYQDAGQQAPSSEDIARTYNEWGKMLADEGQYADAIAKFETVTGTYIQAPTGFAQAKGDAIQAYQNWALQASQAQKYDQATQHYDKLLTQTYCDSACQTQVSALDATAYDKLAEQKLSLQPPDYASAVAAFNQLTTRFGSSATSRGAHADYAKALWGDGQELLTSACSSALTLYQQLSSQFADTSEGKQATIVLKEPEPVKGSFTSSIPGSPETATVGLVQGTTPGMTSDQFYAILLKAPLVTVHSDGTFLFKPIKQGSYYLVWGTFNTSTGAAIFYNAQTYPAAVGPLCTLDMGQINEAFPKA